MTVIAFPNLEHINTIVTCACNAIYEIPSKEVHEALHVKTPRDQAATLFNKAINQYSGNEDVQNLLSGLDKALNVLVKKFPQHKRTTQKFLKNLVNIASKNRNQNIRLITPILERLEDFPQACLKSLSEIIKSKNLSALEIALSSLNKFLRKNQSIEESQIASFLNRSKKLITLMSSSGIDANFINEIDPSILRLDETSDKKLDIVNASALLLNADLHSKTWLPVRLEPDKTNSMRLFKTLYKDALGLNSQSSLGSSMSTNNHLGAIVDLITFIYDQIVLPNTLRGNPDWQKAFNEKNYADYIDGLVEYYPQILERLIDTIPNDKLGKINELITKMKDTCLYDLSRTTKDSSSVTELNSSIELKKGHQDPDLVASISRVKCITELEKNFLSGQQKQELLKFLAASPNHFLVKYSYGNNPFAFIQMKHWTTGANEEKRVRYVAAEGTRRQAPELKMPRSFPFGLLNANNQFLEICNVFHDEDMIQPEDLTRSLASLLKNASSRSRGTNPFIIKDDFCAESSNNHGLINFRNITSIEEGDPQDFNSVARSIRLIFADFFPENTDPNNVFGHGNVEYI